MNREQAEKVLETVLRYTQTDVDYVYDTADGGDEIVPGQDIADAITVAIDAIREQEERRWIPVTERMPEKSGLVLCYWNGHKNMCRFWRQHSCFEFNGRPVKVTHWMPLPEPPKGD